MSVGGKGSCGLLMECKLSEALCGNICKTNMVEAEIELRKCSGIPNMVNTARLGEIVGSWLNREEITVFTAQGSMKLENRMQPSVEFLHP